MTDAMHELAELLPLGPAEVMAVFPGVFEQVRDAFKDASLPDQPNREHENEVLVEIRSEYRERQSLLDRESAPTGPAGARC